MRSHKLTRRSLLGAAATAVAVPSLWGLIRERGYDRDRRRAYESLVDALVEHGALPRGGGASAPGDRLADLYRDALPRRRREIDGVLDRLASARFADKRPAERIDLLRRWAREGGDRRVLAARSLALAGAAFGPADRPLPVVI